MRGWLGLGRLAGCFEHLRGRRLQPDR